MTSTDVDAIINDYLRRVDSALHRLPAARRRQLVSEITEHVSVARSQLPDQSEVSIRNLLERVGSPQDIVAEAIAGQASQNRRFPIRWLAAGAAGLVAVGAAAALAANTPHPVAVPYVVGMPAKQAEVALRSQGFAVQARRRSGNVAPGVVIVQIPAAGSVAPAGSIIRIIVSMGA